MQISFGWHKSSTVFKSVFCFSQVHNAMSIEVCRSIVTLGTMSIRSEMSIHHGGQQFPSLFTYFITIWSTVPNCSAISVPLRAILSPQDKTSHALQLQQCFTVHKSGCVFQVIQPPNKTKLTRHKKFCLHQNVRTPHVRSIFSKYTSKTKNQLMIYAIKWIECEIKGNGIIWINKFLQTCWFVLRIFNSISHRETAEVTSSMYLPEYGSSGFNIIYW
jgi:hypothetical protein